MAAVHKFATGIFVLAFLTSACSPSEPPGLERFDVYFFPPNSDQQIFVGNVVGLEACQIAAGNFAAQLGGARAGYDWSYVCCLNRPDNSCAEKHR